MPDAKVARLEETLAAFIREAIRPIIREELAALRGVEPDGLLNQGAAAQAAGVSTDTIRRWARDGRLPRLGEGRSARYRRADVERAVAKRKRVETSAEDIAMKLLPGGRP